MDVATYNIGSKDVDFCVSIIKVIYEGKSFLGVLLDGSFGVEFLKLKNVVLIPHPFQVKMAYQRRVYLVGTLRNQKSIVASLQFLLNFVAVQMNEPRLACSMLLG